MKADSANKRLYTGQEGLRRPALYNPQKGAFSMLTGIGASEGYGIGTVLVLKEQNLHYTPKTNCVPKEELQRYRSAVDKFCLKTEKAAEKIKNSVGEKEAEILSGHILMIRDPYMNAEIEKLIENKTCAESALESICDMFIMIFSSAEDDLTKQRATDVRDIKAGVLSILLGQEEIDLAGIPENTILVAKDLTPSMTAGIPKGAVAGIITEIGGQTSHSAILARAMEIPAVLSVSDAASLLKNGQTVITDGINGTVIVNPDSRELEEYSTKRDRFSAQKRELSKFIGKKTTTADGFTVELFGNIGNAEEAAGVMACDGEGVGLFRTEFLFMDRANAPTQEEQFDAYKKAVLTLKGKPLIIRTLDIGGDKDIPYMHLQKEENPFLGFRAIRYCLQNTALYKAQLRALLRASAFGDIRIMVPLVTGISELRTVKTLLAEISAELKKDGIPFNEHIKVGVMIETPAASMIADILAKEADFFSIGTNDLTQYTMAADRGNASVSYLCSPFDIAVLRSIQNIIACAKHAGIPVGMCGEAAADKRLIPLFLSFGLDEFSVTPASVLSVRKTISEWTAPRAQALAEKVMAMTTQQEILDFLTASV